MRGLPAAGGPNGSWPGRGLERPCGASACGTQGVTDWAARVYAAGGELPFHVAQWTPRLGLLVPFIQQQARETLAARVVVEVGGEAPEVLRQVMMTATMVITPTGTDYYPVRRLVADTARCPDRDWLSLPENVRRACRAISRAAAWSFMPSWGWLSGPAEGRAPARWGFPSLSPGPTRERPGNRRSAWRCSPGGATSAHRPRPGRAPRPGTACPYSPGPAREPTPAWLCSPCISATEFRPVNPSEAPPTSKAWSHRQAQAEENPVPAPPYRRLPGRDRPDSRSLVTTCTTNST